jgi:hypothetical protein
LNETSSVPAQYEEVVNWQAGVIKQATPENGKVKAGVFGTQLSGFETVVPEIEFVGLSP